MRTHRTCGFWRTFCLLGLSLCTTLSSVQAATVVSLVSGNATPAYYNNSIGDLGATQPGGILPWFPAPNTFSGVQDQVFTTAPDLSAAAAALGDWLTDPAQLNANWTRVSAVPANWLVNTEVAIVYSFDAGPGLRDITAAFGNIDNGINIWLDGVWKFGARDPEGRPWSGIALGDVGAGTHYIQILLEDSGGATAYLNPGITATVVPVPAAAWLFVTGLVTLGGITRYGK